MRPKILVTGASGFTGRHLRIYLEKYFDCNVISLTTDSQIHDENLNILDDQALEGLISKTQPTHVIHLAAISSVLHQDKAELYSVNVVGTVNLLTALEKHAKFLNKVIVASTSNIYGTSSVQKKFNENDIPNPINHYAVSKHCMEQAVQFWMEKLPIDILRPFNYTGLGQSTNFLVPKIVNAFKYKQEELILGSLNVERDFTDVRNVTYVYGKLLFDNASGRTFNVCSGNAISPVKILDMCKDMCGYSPIIQSNVSLMREEELTFHAGDPQKLLAEIGDFQLYSFRETIEWMLNDNVHG